MHWPYEDGGPRRTQVVPGGLGLRGGHGLRVTTRVAPLCTMVAGEGDDVFLLRHTAGDDAVAIVERIDPKTLEAVASSGELPGGPTWPGGIGRAADGSVHVVFGNHAHRLDTDLRLLASRRLLRDRPYNSFVTVSDGSIVTKDFAGSRPGHPASAHSRQPSEMVVLDPVGLEVLDRVALPEPSVARLSADGDTVYAVGDPSLLRLRWDGRQLALDADFRPAYRVHDGQGFGWDCVLAGGAAWFLDNGDGSEAFAGTMRGLGVATAPLHLVRVDLDAGEVDMVEVCGLPGGIVANPPVVDVERGVAVGYDSGNGVMAAFDCATLAPRWRKEQDHASHMLLFEQTGELVTGDGADVVVLDIESGAELARADSGLGMQSVLFPAPGAAGEFYVCAFTGVSRLSGA